jgi:putative glutamine amidotransferase
MKRAPLILISPCTETKGVEFRDTSNSLSRNYAKAITSAGGLPWVASCLPDKRIIRDSVQRCDGVMLTGGEDVEPKRYIGRLPQKLRRTVSPPEPDRDEFELMLIDEVFRQRKPLLAICRGQQILNVALGGTLVVDIRSQIPNALNHRSLDRKDQIVHDVELTPETLIARIVGQTKLGVNSSHHQAVARIAGPLHPTARSEDGIVESLELKPTNAAQMPYLLAVQFHPERLCARHREHWSIFRSFTRACAENDP